jgi:hypothetical protein
MRIRYSISASGRTRPSPLFRRCFTMVSLQIGSEKHRASFNVALACMVFLENRGRIFRAAYTVVKRFRELLTSFFAE